MLAETSEKQQGVVTGSSLETDPYVSIVLYIWMFRSGNPMIVAFAAKF